MSIKTAKRLALGVIASLVFAPLAVVAPAGAAAAAATPYNVSAASFKPADSFAATVAVQQVAGANNFVSFASGADTTGANLVPVVKVTGSTITDVVTDGDTPPTGTLNAAATELVYSSHDIYNATASTASSFKVPTTTAGTITVVVALRGAAVNGVVPADTTLQTFTITVLATAVTNVYSAANSTVLAVKATQGTGIADATTATTTTDAAAISTPAIEAAAAAGTVEVLAIAIDQEDSNDVNLSTAVKNEISISPIGRVGIAVDTPLGAYTTETAQASDFYVFADGREGEATVTVSVNSVVVKTYKVKFYGAVTSLVATSKISSIDADGGAVAGVIEVLASDKAGVPVPGQTIAFDKAADSTLISNAVGATTTASTGKALVTVTPVAAKYGTTTVTVKIGTVISNPITVVLAHNAIASATLSLDKTTYLPGEKATLTLAAKDKNNLIVPDALDAAGHMAFASNVGLSAALGTGTLAWVAGSYSQSIFAPQTTTLTDWIITAKMDSDAAFATAVQGSTVTTATVKVGFPVAVVYDKPTLQVTKVDGKILLSGTAVEGEGDIIVYLKKVGTTKWVEQAATIEVAAPGDYNGLRKAPKFNVLVRVKQEGTGMFSNQVVVRK